VNKNLWAEASELFGDNVERFKALPQETQEVLVVADIRSQLLYLEQKRLKAKAAYQESLQDIVNQEKSLMVQLRAVRGQPTFGKANLVSTESK